MPGSPAPPLPAPLLAPGLPFAAWLVWFGGGFIPLVPGAPTP
ncbi:hypothetical protein HX91_0448, partial [Mycobacterium tuberculosis]